MAADDKGAKKPSSKLEEDIFDQVKRQILFGKGYGRPPVEHQFKKGQSGNPSGRPRGARHDLGFSDLASNKAVVDAFSKKVNVRDGDGVRELGRMEALAETLYVHATKGNARSAGLVLDWYRSAEIARVQEIKAKNVAWTQYKENVGILINEARARGEPEPSFLPHPDDVIIDAETGPTFIGPISEDEQRDLEDTLAVRDVLIMQEALDGRTSHRRDGTPVDDPGAALMMAQMLNKIVPERYRLSDHQFVMTLSRHEGIAKRQLLKQLYAAWRKCGHPKVRGYISPDLQYVAKTLGDYVAMYVEHKAGRLDIDAMARGIYDENARRFMQERGLH